MRRLLAGGVLCLAVLLATATAAAADSHRVGAMCEDGTHSYATGQGACSHHGGVDYWLYSSERAPEDVSWVDKGIPVGGMRIPTWVVPAAGFIGFYGVAILLNRSGGSAVLTPPTHDHDRDAASRSAEADPNRHTRYERERTPRSLSTSPRGRGTPLPSPPGTFDLPVAEEPHPNRIEIAKPLGASKLSVRGTLVEHGWQVRREGDGDALIAWRPRGGQVSIVLQPLRSNSTMLTVASASAEALSAVHDLINENCNS